ncbi:MAG: 3-hydroxyacyl-ACP dehydratase FabZ [Pseudomonadota bacterium]
MTDIIPQMAYSIADMLPQRYPFLLIDRLLKCEPDKSGIGIKNVTINEYYFQGHFPGKPIVPGVLIIESCAQMLGLVCFDPHRINEAPPMLASVKDFTFKQPVEPGDSMLIFAEIISNSFNFIVGKVRVKTQKGLVATGTIINTNKK